MLFKRDYVLYIRKAKDNTTDEVIEIRDLRIDIDVHKTTELEPNTAKIKIYNLARSTRDKLKKKGGYMHLEAGYAGEMKMVFQGNIREIDHTREKTEWVTTFHSSDGLIPLQSSKCVQSFPPKTTVKDALKSMAQQMTLETALTADLADLEDIEGELPDGFASAGSTAAAMTKLLEGADRVWSIQDGKLQIRKRGEPAKGTILLISPDSGLIGSPTHVAAEQSQNTSQEQKLKVPPPTSVKLPKKPNRKSVAHVKAKCLMNGEIRCGTKVAIKSENINGVFMVDLVNHKGDSWGSEWSSEFEAVALSESIS